MVSPQTGEESFQTAETALHPLEDYPKQRTRGVLISLRAYPKIAAYCFALSLSTLLTGFDVIILVSITALPPFQQDYGKPFKDSYIVPSMWLALWSASTFLGQMLGAIVAGWLQDKKGRKPSLLLGSIISAAAIALCFTSYLAGDINIRRGLFLVGKTITGVALGILMSTTQTFISEITSADLRGPMLALLPINTLLGQLIGAGVVFGLSHATSRRPYLIALATQWPLAVLVFVVALVVPESPAYLVAQGRSDVALRSLAKLHTSRVDLVSKLEEVVRFVRHGEQHSDTHTYLDCFKKKHVRQTFIVLFAGVIPQLFGFSTLSQAGYFMQVIGMAPTLSLAVLFLCLLLGLIANILGIWSISKIGRRKLILASLSLSTLIWFAMGVAGFWSSPAVAWYSAGTFMAIAVVNGLGAWPASFAVAGETSSLLLRAKTQGLNWFSNSLVSGLLSLALPWAFNPDAAYLGSKTGFVFAGLCMIGTFVCWLIIPEMKGKSHAEIERMFGLKVSTRKFNRWSLSEDTQELRQR